MTYDKSMQRLAKPLPLETPTIIELSPGNEIRVTLFDANHCVGAVMFLIEGDGKAILYTGDIRAETWWVNSLVQNPLLLPYTIGSRLLDCIYLDTTFATKSSPYREFPSKAAGIRELLEKVEAYPEDTSFYFHSWTFGYENVWIALSAFLKSPIHVDDYRCSIYASLSNLDKESLREGGLTFDRKRGQRPALDIREAAALCGFRNGNHVQPGCLTSCSSVRIHSCERGTGCPVVDHDTAANVVHIIPIVTRANGTEIAEIGAGGGKGDLDQKEELETGNVTDIGKLMEVCSAKIEDKELRTKVLAMLQQTLRSGNGKIDLGFHMSKESQDSDDELTLQGLISVLSHHVTEVEEPLRRTIRFPYSRHSSYSELCILVDAFRPRDVYPCTVDDESWSPSHGMRDLFSEYCSAGTFRHDLEMMETYERRLKRELVGKHQLETQERETDVDDPHISSPKKSRFSQVTDGSVPNIGINVPGFFTPTELLNQTNSAQSSQIKRVDGAILSTAKVITGPRAVSPRRALHIPTGVPTTVDLRNVSTSRRDTKEELLKTSKLRTAPSNAQNPPARRTPRLTNRQIAYKAAIGDGLTWADYDGLVSTRPEQYDDEVEL